ncbi:MAG: sensor histidine kinase YesM [Saprospiraceae bacterium]|jgi:sensor histidine kinase YesM
MILNKEKRIKYFGFNYFWFVIIGILIVSLIIDYLFNNSFVNYAFGHAMISWGMSIFFTMCNWFTLRYAMISLRKKLPSFQDNIKRSALLFFIMICIVLAVDSLGNFMLSYVFGDSYHPLSKSRILIPILLISTMILAIYEAIYYYIRLQNYIRHEEQAKQLVVQAKLDALRNQAQPHFLFNSLNTLRDIIDHDSKDDAKKFVDKLSDVYRFILDTGNANLVTLRDELKFAKAYIHIQSERFGDNLKLVWNINETALDQKVVPMSLQLLLENAIKHNVISKAKPLEILVKVERDKLIVANKIQPKSTQLPSTQLGLKNIEKRYSLISENIPSILNDGNKFIVSIPLLVSTKNYNHADTHS